MTIEELLKDKTKKIKAKTETISKWLTDSSLSTDELIAFAGKSNDTEKATCIEALEYATKLKPKIGDENVLAFITEMLTEKAPRIKWESAKVIGNIAQNFPEKLDPATEKLLENTRNNGTVVRWATAYALGEILKLKTQNHDFLLSKIVRLSEVETENGVKKKYFDAIKNTKANQSKSLLSRPDI